MKKNFIFLTLALLASLIIGLTAGIIISIKNPQLFSNDLLSPFVSQKLIEKKYPLNQYRFSNLSQRQYQTSPLTVSKLVKTEASYQNYLFSYQTMNKKMTGSVNIPLGTPPKSGWPVIVMVRGYAEPDNYYSGYGTKNAAAKFAEAGYVTIAPDFFGFGGSDADFEDSWEGRFVKPINVIELIKSVHELTQLDYQPELITQEKLNSNSVKLDPDRLGIWAHSNGGQISLSVLEILSADFPTTLWAPVTAPFPYSILYFTFDNPDEGKEARAWVAMFEENYDVFEFSVTQHLDKLQAPVQIHHGSADDQALLTWSENFLNLVEVENQRRADLEASRAARTTETTETMETEKVTEADLAKTENENSETNPKLLAPIQLKLYSYPGADHNLQPGWNTAIQRDLEFFKEELK